MFGGLKSTSLAALVATAGVALAGLSAQAADLGGNCCADLEERIAELEATTARKGNRKVSLTVSGWVNEGVLAFDDGVEKNAYVVTNDTARTRFRFLGSAKIDASWSAGYLMEIGVGANRSKGVDQNNANDQGATTFRQLDVRHSAWWIEHKDLGKVWVGQTSQAADSITEINLANVGHFSIPEIYNYIGSFRMRNANGTLATTTVNSITNSNANIGEGFRYNLVKYQTPTLAGFIGSASWGEDDFWDVALRYAGEFSGIKLAAGIAFAKWNDGTSNPRSCARVSGTGTGVSCDELGMSGSVMHVGTGLFVTGAYGNRNDDLITRVVAGSKAKSEFYMIQAGIEQKFNPLGRTTIFGEYFNGDYGAAITKGSAAAGTFAAAVSGATLGLAGNINSSNISMWGVGFNQNIEAAAMDIYVDYRNYSFDIRTDAVPPGANKATVNDLQTVIMGARIQF